MCLYPFTAPDIYRARWKFSFHNSKTCFYLPASFADRQNIRHAVIKKVGAYGIQTIIAAFFLYFFSIQFIMDIRTFPVIRGGKFIDKTCRVIWILFIYVYILGSFSLGLNVEFCWGLDFLSNLMLNVVPQDLESALRPVTLHQVISDWYIKIPTANI